jgi:hypothetical protein
MTGRGSGLSVQAFLINYVNGGIVALSGIIDYTAMNNVDFFFGTYEFVV